MRSMFTLGEAAAANPVVGPKDLLSRMRPSQRIEKLRAQALHPERDPRHSGRAQNLKTIAGH